MDHYPVKRRGEKRQLNPNTEGIAWLDARAARDGTLTRVCGMTDSGVVVVEGLEGAPFNIVQGDWGWDDSRPNPRYVRPMFQPLNPNVLVIGGDAMICPDPCPNCYDYAYAWNCPDHGREGRKDAYATRPAGGAFTYMDVSAFVREWAIVSLDTAAGTITLSWEANPS